MKYKEAENSEQGVCPYCGGISLVYDAFEMEDAQAGSFLTTCEDCGKEFQECYNLNFACNAIQSEVKNYDNQDYQKADRRHL